MVTPIKNYHKFAQMEGTRRVTVKDYGGWARSVKDSGGGYNIVIILPFTGKDMTESVIKEELKRA